MPTTAHYNQKQSCNFKRNYNSDNYFDPLNIPWFPSTSKFPFISDSSKKIKRHWSRES